MKYYDENVKTYAVTTQEKKILLEENCAKIFEEISFEITSSGTPQQNGVVEQGFNVLYFWMRAMMVKSRLHENLNTGLWYKYTVTTTKIENIMVNPHEEKLPTRSSMVRFQNTKNT